MRKTILCPYCYEEFGCMEMEFRCQTVGCPDHDKEMELSEKQIQSAIKRGAVCPHCHNRSGRFCPHCKHELPETVFDDDIQNVVISVIGQRATGKSVFLGVLIHELFYDELVAKVLPGGATSDFNKSLARYDEQFSALYHDANRKQTLDETAVRIHQSVAAGEYLPFIWKIGRREKSPWPSWIPVLGKDRLKSFTMFLFDPAGEDLLEQGKMQAAWYRYLSHSTGFIFLLDPMHLPHILRQLDDETVHSASGKPKDVLLAEALQSTNDVISELTNHVRKKQGLTENEPIDIPIAVTVPKYDVISEFIPKECAVHRDSPHRRRRGFDMADCNQVSSEMKSLLQEWDASAITRQIERNFNRVSYFSVSSLGTDNNPRKDHSIETPHPHRIEDPLLWLWKEAGLIKVIK